MLLLKGFTGLHKTVQLQLSSVLLVGAYSSVMSASLWPHESRHVRPPCPSPTPRVYPNSCPSNWWCHSPISSSVMPLISPSIRVISNESTLYMRWTKYWSFSFHISPTSEHPRLIFFRLGHRLGLNVVLSGLPWKQIAIFFFFFPFWRLHPSAAFKTLLLSMMATLFLLKDSSPQ